MTTAENIAQFCVEVSQNEALLEELIAKLCSKGMDERISQILKLIFKNGLNGGDVSVVFEEISKYTDETYDLPQEHKYELPPPSEVPSYHVDNTLYEGSEDSLMTLADTLKQNLEEQVKQKQAESEELNLKKEEYEKFKQGLKPVCDKTFEITFEDFEKDGLIVIQQKYKTWKQRREQRYRAKARTQAKEE